MGKHKYFSIDPLFIITGFWVIALSNKKEKMKKIYA